MSFRDIAGHDREIGIIRGAVSLGRVAHALLFAGPDGIGKKKTAIGLAQALNCDNYKDDSCGACDDCVRMEGGTHQNLVTVWPIDKPLDKGGERDDVGGLIRIDQVRDVLNAVRFKVEKGRRVVVVESAERFMPQAANAFLKTLEEPPAGSIIILLTSRVSDLLPTILSRCQRINFRPLDAGTLSSIISAQLGCAHQEAATIARLSGGSVARARALVSEGADEKRREIGARLSGLKDGDLAGAMKMAEELSKRDDLGEVLELMKGWYRDAIVVAEGAPELAVNSDMIAGLQGRGASFNRLWSAFSVIEAARRDIMAPRNANKQLAMEVMMLGIIA